MNTKKTEKKNIKSFWSKDKLKTINMGYDLTRRRVALRV